MKRTIQQQNTIDAPCGNILVSAAAGSGKTSVMTERIVTRILSGQLDIRNVLVMTFTDAAAKSMRKKIDQRLNEALANATDRELQHFCTKQIAFLTQSSISTIHSFCLDVVRNFYYEATDKNGKVLMEPGFRIEDQGEAGIILAQALDDVFEKHYSSCDQEPCSKATSDFLFLVDSYGSSKNDAPLRQMLLSFYRFMRSMPDYTVWIENQKNILNDIIKDFDSSKCYKTLFQGLLLRFKRAGEGMKELRHLLSCDPVLYRDKKKNTATLAAYQEFLHFMEEVVKILHKDNPSWDELHGLFLTKPVIPALRKGKDDTGEKSQIMELFDNYFAEFLYYTTGEFGTDKYTSNFVFAKCFVFTKNKEDIVQELETMQPAIEKFCDILLELDELYTNAKFTANMIDFGDFEHLALRILRAPNVRAYYQEKFQEIYIDEYQDTSSIQEAILEQIAKENCFMVGDVKQSIYKFRHARPQIFMDKSRSFAKIEFLKSGTLFELNKNFRSVTGILNAVNDVFYQIMSYKAGEIEYNSAQSLVPHHEDIADAPTPVEILLIDVSIREQKAGSSEGIDENISTEESNITEANEENIYDSCDETESESGRKEKTNSSELFLTKEESTKYEKEALGVALKIKELLAQGIKPEQIAVLARTKNICAVFASMLISFDFPVEQEQSDAFLDRYELKVMESFLRILDNPMQDIPLVSVMRSCLFEDGFSEEELLTIRVSYRNKENFYECCKMYSVEGQESELKEKLNTFYSWLSDFRARLKYLTVSELIETVYTKTGFLSQTAIKEDGAQRVLSLQQFQDWARGFDQSRQTGLYSFVRFMESIHNKAQSQSPFGVETSQSDSIKVMTMHKSKGLEYKIVFLVGNDRKMTSKDTKEAILVSEEFGIGFQYVDTKLRFKYPTPLIFAMREGMRNAELAEEMRLFYVGMTRAENRLFITGTCNNSDNVEGRGFAALIEKVRECPPNEPIPPHVVLSAKSTMEWIMMSLARNPYVDFSKCNIPSYNITKKGDMSYENSEIAGIGKNDRNEPFYSKSWSISVTNHQDALIKSQEIQSKKIADTKEEGIATGSKFVDVKTVCGESQDNPSDYDQNAIDIIQRKFSYEYPHESSTQRPLKISVSEMKRREQEEIQDRENSPVESNLRGINTTMKDLDSPVKATLDKREIGIAVHSFLRYMNLDEVMVNPNKESIENHLGQMLEMKIIKQIEFEYLVGYTDFFTGYLQSNLAKRIYKVKVDSPRSLYREIPFTMKLESPGQDKTFVQGMIDCWFIEDGEAVLVDYKTDTIHGSKEEVSKILESRYKTQLYIYAEAITKITGFHVKESIIWLVNAKNEFIIDINQV